MRGPRKKRKRTISGTVAIDGFDLCWELHSEPQFTSEHGYKGLRISVKLAEGARRELMLEFPFPKRNATELAHYPEPPKVTAGAVEAAIRQAMEAGWNPA